MVSETEPSAVPRAEYSRRVEELSVERSNLQRRERLVGYVQLGLGAFCLGWILFRVRHFSQDRPAGPDSRSRPSSFSLSCMGGCCAQ